MANSWSIAGTIGTWVAVILAILALTAIIGPILVWRASKTKKQQALDALEHGDAESGGFVTKGIPFWPGIRLLRRVQVPKLSSEPSLAGKTVIWDAFVPQVSSASSSWVHLARVLKSYRLNTSISNTLIIRNRKTVLEVNYIWLLLIGILGRFGRRKDMGKLPQRSKGLLSAQARPGTMLSRRVREAAEVTPGWKTSRPWAHSRNHRGNSEGEFEQDGRTYWLLHGLIGTMYLAQRSRHLDDQHDRVQYRNHTPQEIGDLSIEPLAIDDLFWLAVGCLVAPRRRIYSLENVQALPYLVDEEEEQDEEESPRRRPPVSPVVRFDIEDDPYDPWEGEARRSPISPTAYVVPSSSTKDRYTFGPRGFKFTENSERMETLGGLARSVEALEQEVTVFSLEEIELSDDEKEMLQQDSETTYVSSESPWIRLGPGTHSGAWFLKRGDGQTLTQALLSLPLCPQGYLISGNKDSVLRTMLCAASEALPQLLVRMAHDMECLVLEPADRNELVVAIEQLLARTLQYEYNRRFASALFNLDVVLQRLQHPDIRANHAVGVLMITNPEFRALIAQSARHIPASVNTSVVVDVENGCLTIPTVMGIMQKFAIDFDAVMHENDRQDTPITLSYTMLMILSLKASLRSTFFETSLDSLPLFEKVMSMKDQIAYVG